MLYNISFSAALGIFPVPCEVVDRYINEASFDELRVLLTLYRNAGGETDTETLGEQLGISEGKIKDALKYWGEKKLFTAQPKESERPQPEARRAPAKKILDTHAQYGAEEVAAKVSGNAEIKFLLDAAPGLLGRLLSPADCSTLLYLYDGAGLPADVILMLIEYCVSSGHANLRYIEKVALSWAEDGIDTHERAESRIRELEAFRSFEGKIRSMMGISGRALTSAERQHIARWAAWGSPEELIRQAYEICVNRTGKLSFSYINSILSAWHDKGIETVEQAKSENRQKPKSGRPASYDIDEYVDLSMKRLLNE